MEKKMIDLYKSDYQLLTINLTNLSYCSKYCDNRIDYIYKKKKKIELI